MTIQQLLTILQARIKLILHISLAIIVCALLASIIIPKKYKATTSLIVNYKYTDPISGGSIPAQLMPGYMSTQVDVITSKETALSVINELTPDQLQEFKEDFQDETDGEDDFNDWLAEVLLKKLIVEPSRTSNIINITYKASTPDFAAKVANAFASAYIKKSIELKVEPSRHAAEYFTTQLKQLQTNLVNASKKFSDYQREHNIVDIDGNLDVETARLNDLSKQLVASQGQLMEARSREINVDNSPTDSPDVSSDVVVQTLKTKLSSEEAWLVDLSQQYSVNHPEYIAAKAKVDQLRTELAKQIRSTSNTVRGTANIYAKRESQIQGALNAQKQKVLNLNSSRNQLRILQQAVDTAQQTYNAAVQRFNQNNFEGQSDQSNISILSKATSPRKAYFPKLWLNLALAFILGPFLGIGFVILSELMDRRIRSESDILSIIDAPSFGTLPKLRTENLDNEDENENTSALATLKRITMTKLKLLPN